MKIYYNKFNFLKINKKKIVAIEAQNINFALFAD